METKCEDLCNALAKCVVARDFKGAHSLLVPWYRSTISPSELERMVDAANEGLAHPPHAWIVGEGVMGLDELRKPDPYGPPSQAISKEITDRNFRGWLHIQFAPEPSVHEEQNVCFDLWLVAVEHDGSIQVGYLEAAEAT